MAVPLYTQYTEAGGISIEASAQVSPYALAEAKWLVGKLVPPPDMRAIATAGIRVVIVGTTEMVTDLPDFSTLAPKVWWDRRYRGLGPTDDRLVVLCPEEDLLGLPGDRLHGEYSICLHELTHAVDFVRTKRDSGWRVRVDEAYAQSMASGLWADTYASSSAGEYFVAGAEVWFGDYPPSAEGLGLQTRAALAAYDPGLAAVCREVFGNGRWRYVVPSARPPADRAHLVGFDRTHATPFAWPDRASWDLPEMSVDWTEDPPSASPGSKESAWLIIANHRRSRVDLDWLDFEGKRRPFHSLRPGEELLQDAYVGHIWYVHAGERDLGAIVVGSGVRYLEIGPISASPVDESTRASWNLDAMRLPWSQHPPTVSTAADDMTWLLFVNHRDRDVLVEWLDFDGVRRHYHTLEPGEELLRDAYVGHVWWVRDPTAGDVGAIVVGATPGYVEIK